MKRLIFLVWILTGVAGWFFYANKNSEIKEEIVPEEPVFSEQDEQALFEEWKREEIQKIRDSIEKADKFLAKSTEIMADSAQNTQKALKSSQKQIELQWNGFSCRLPKQDSLMAHFSVNFNVFSKTDSIIVSKFHENALIVVCDIFYLDAPDKLSISRLNSLLQHKLQILTNIPIVGASVEQFRLDPDGT